MEDAMKKAMVLALVLSMAVPSIFAANPFDEFKNQVTGAATDVVQKGLNGLTKDLGALMGGGAFHQAKSLGFPGLDVGIHIPAKKNQ